MIKTIDKNVTAEIVRKKSRFIANMFYVKDVAQAEEIIKQVKKQYHDAKHNCFAFSISNTQGIVKKSSDDGEPTGTAGMPLLNILEKNNLNNVLIIVTRYFGGTLLGTGGLLRAYSDVAIQALQNTNIIHEYTGLDVFLQLDYSNLEKFKYYCRKNNINITNIQYDNDIKCVVEVTKQEKEKIIKDNEKIIKKYEYGKQKKIRK